MAYTTITAEDECFLFQMKKRKLFVSHIIYNRLNHTDLRKSAPAHKTGAKCFGKFKPNKLITQKIANPTTGVKSN